MAKPKRAKPAITVEEARALVATLHSEQSSLSAKVAAACRVLDAIGLTPQPRVEVTVRDEVVIQRVPATREFLLEALGRDARRRSPSERATGTRRSGGRRAR